MIYGETGRYSLYVTVYTRMVSYWGRLYLNPNKIVCNLYRYQYDFFCKMSYNNSWLSCIKNIFDICGHSNIWNEQVFFLIHTG
jgi:hypothetical protein